MIKCPYCGEELLEVLAEEEGRETQKTKYVWDKDRYDFETVEDYEEIEWKITKMFCPYCGRELPKDVAEKIREVLE